MDIVCSSMGMDAVTWRVEAETLTIRGWSAAAGEGAQSLTVASSRAMMSGDIYFA